MFVDVGWESIVGGEFGVPFSAPMLPSLCSLEVALEEEAAGRCAAGTDSTCNRSIIASTRSMRYGRTASALTLTHCASSEIADVRRMVGK